MKKGDDYYEVSWENEIWNFVFYHQALNIQELVEYSWGISAVIKIKKVNENTYWVLE